jgi:DNA-binding MarR family transcriptional regulator
VTQFTLLQALTLAKGISQGQLADLLGIDSTTLTRTLAVLRRRGWIRAERGQDRRHLQLLLTDSGQRQYQRALRYWQSAQKRLRDALGEADWERMLTSAVRIAEVR